RVAGGMLAEYAEPHQRPGQGRRGVVDCGRDARRERRPGPGCCQREHFPLVKPMPGNQMTPSLAESWTVSADQRAYEFKLRERLKFHNGDPFTAEDVKFSFMRAKGSKVLRERVKEVVVVVSPSRVRFQLHEPFPDFMAFYGTMATGAGWIVPKKYVETGGGRGVHN